MIHAHQLERDSVQSLGKIHDFCPGTLPHLTFFFPHSSWPTPPSPYKPYHIMGLERFLIRKAQQNEL